MTDSYDRTSSKVLQRPMSSEETQIWLSERQKWIDAAGENRGGLYFIRTEDMDAAAAYADDVVTCVQGRTKPQE